MKQQIATTGPPRPDVWAAWQHELQSQRDAKLATDLRQRQSALYPRFNDFYRRLHALPRRWRRGIGRRLRQTLAGVALLLALGHGAAFAAIINVDGAVCTLADAITAANTDTATGGCPAGSGADTLVLLAGSTTTLTLALPGIESKITIEGNGATIERSAAAGTPDFGILRVDSDGALTLNQTTIRGGTGGGISSDGNLTINDSTISGNSADRGGGIKLLRADATITNSTIDGNIANGNGGGIWTARGELTINDSTISGNSADHGGGIQLYGSYSTITNSTIDGNIANGNGGGVALDGYLYDDNTLILDNSTVTDNVAASSGGGIHANGVYDNVGYKCYCFSSDVTIHRSIVSGNTAPVGAELRVDGRTNGPTVVSRIESRGDSLFGESGKTSSDAFYAQNGQIILHPTDITATSDGTNPTALEDILEPVLGFNGGPTQTHALVEGSPAVDAAGVDCPPPVTDQRGINRPQGAACDIGAFEGWVGNVNDLVTFDPDTSSYQSTRDATGCPPGYAGRYGFAATLANVSGLDLNSLSAKVDTLTGGNLVLASDGGLLGTGDKVPVAREGDYADGTLSPGETAETPFEICMKKWRGFRFFVDAFGSAVTD